MRHVRSYNLPEPDEGKAEHTRGAICFVFHKSPRGENNISSKNKQPSNEGCLKYDGGLIDKLGDDLATIAKLRV